MIWQKEITLPKYDRGMQIITDTIEEHLPELPKTGLLNVFIKHTSAGLTINENADPTVRDDMKTSLDYMIREDEPFYKHTAEGADDMPAHIKSSVVGSSVTIPITGNKLNLGTWQGIYLCEFRDYPGQRKLILTVYG